MEIFKDIYFNTDKLIENTNVKVSYTGYFYQGNSDKVYLHYGYGKDWDNVDEIEMNRTDLGFQAEINLANSDTLNFCFKNQNNEWDNNFGQNYSFAIERKAEGVDKASDSSSPKTNLVYVGKIFGGSNNSDAMGADALGTGTIGGDVLGADIASADALGTDAFLPDKADIVINTVKNENQAQEVPQNIAENQAVANVNQDDSKCFKVITSNLDVISTPSNVMDNINKPDIKASAQQTTAIALAPKGFEYWTQRIKNTVCNFFAYVPKLISGNYKRELKEKNDK